MHGGLTSVDASVVVRRRLGPLVRRFSGADRADDVLHESAVDDLHIVTGFGPTNAPTAGTLSVMLGVIELQRRLGAPMTVIISELGAWNSRNIPWTQLEAVRDQMFEFLRRIGADQTKTGLRSHLDHENLVRAGRIARYLSRQDFLDHKESLLELYDAHGLLGSEVGIVVDSLYTVADVLEPAENGTGHVLMISGAEEAYFTKLSRLVLERQQNAGDLGMGWQATIGALYFRVLEGLAGYPKMSKSIPASSIHLGMTAEMLASRILTDDPSSQSPILSAMELASGWDDRMIVTARVTHDGRETEPSAWRQMKKHFLDTFVDYAKMWKISAP